jgi:cytochrome P450
MLVSTSWKLEKDAWSVPLDQISVAQPQLFKTDEIWPYFERLRREAPVHYCAESDYGPYWSATCFRDIVAIESDTQTFSSEAPLGGITINDQKANARLPMFIAMDPPRHTARRSIVESIFTQSHLIELEGRIRTATAVTLDALPRDEDFDWVQKVSIELSTQMLAVLLDFPWEDRRLLAHWSDVATAAIDGEHAWSEQARNTELLECLAYFTMLWNERVNSEPSNDLISMLAHSKSTRQMNAFEYLGNIVLLIVGGSDTTRNSITGGLLAMMSEFPDEYRKLRARPELLPSAVSEIFRWQTPLAHMRRTAVRDTEFRGCNIRAGQKIILWYVSANRDEAVIADPNRFSIERPHARKHLAFGLGIHRCVGARLGTMQIRVLWEEILKRFPRIDVVAPASRVESVFVRGFHRLMVRIPRGA